MFSIVYKLICPFSFIIPGCIFIIVVWFLYFRLVLTWIYNDRLSLFSGWFLAVQVMMTLNLILSLVTCLLCLLGILNFCPAHRRSIAQLTNAILIFSCGKELFWKWFLWLHFKGGGRHLDLPLPVNPEIKKNCDII